MDPVILLITAGLLALLALPLVATGLFISVRHSSRLQFRLVNAERVTDLAVAELRDCLKRHRPVRGQMPPGTVTIDLAEQVRQVWSAAGYDHNEMAALRMVSIAHRIIATSPMTATDADGTFNAADSSPPARTNCQSGPLGCTYPDCPCETLPEPPPPMPTRESNQ